MATYCVYPIYGKDKPSCLRGVPQRMIIGIAKEITDVSSYREHAVFSGESTLIVDWKSRRYKVISHHCERRWDRFKMSDWYRDFRFTSPCEDWELESKGYIVDTVQL